MLSGTGVIKTKQKWVLILKTLGLSLLLVIPMTINFMSRLHLEAWMTTAVVAVLAGCILVLYRIQHKLNRDIEKVCHQLGPGVKLIGKFGKAERAQYQIFQEGHRYYYLQHTQTGERRLVPKEKILQDFDLSH